MVRSEEFGSPGHAEGDVLPPGRVRWVRAGMLVLGGVDTVIGAWALFAPRSFHDDFPGGPFRWISPFGAYNMHLIADVGGAYLMMAVLLALGARGGHRPVVRLALVVVGVQGLIHLLWHLVHLDMIMATGAGNAIGLVIVLAAAAALPVALLAATRTPRGHQSEAVST